MIPRAAALGNPARLLSFLLHLDPNGFGTIPKSFGNDVKRTGFATCLWPRTARARRLLLLALSLALVALVAVYWIEESGVFGGNAFSASAARLLVLEDCDSDFRTPPFEDAVVTFGA